VRWCLPLPPNATLLSACKAVVAKGDTADVAFDCVAGGDPAACREMVASGAADLVVVGGSDQLPAHNEHNLEVIAAGGRPTSCCLRWCFCSGVQYSLLGWCRAFVPWPVKLGKRHWLCLPPAMLPAERRRESCCKRLGVC
jgi:hypothetical protein